MNQDNNYNFNPMINQPVQNPQPVVNYQPVGQPVEIKPTNTVSPQPPMPEKKNTKLIIAIVVLLIVSIVEGVIIFILLNDKEPSNNKTGNTEIVDNNQNTNGSNENVNGENNTNEDGDFLLAIEDAFTITGKGLVVTGKIERGTVRVGDTIEIIGLDHEILTTEVVSIEMFRKELQEASAGDNVGIGLKDITRDQVERGQVLAKPNSITAVTKFDADVYILTKDEGGRHTPFFTNYRPQFYFRTTDVTGVITLPAEVEMVMPGDNTSFTVTLISEMAIEVGTEFSIREGGRTVGNGTVTKIYE